MNCLCATSFGVHEVPKGSKGWHMINGLPLVKTFRPPFPPSQTSTQSPFYMLSLNSHFSGADLGRGAQWPSTPELPLHTAQLLSPKSPRSQRATYLCHPLEIQQQEHLPFLHAALEAFTLCDATLSPQGWPSPGAKDAYPSLLFF